MRTWITDDDRWRRRTSIIIQNGAKDATDDDLLADAVIANIDDRDFFIRKAHRLGAARARQVRPRLGSGLRRRPHRPALATVTAGGDEAPLGLLGEAALLGRAAGRAVGVAGVALAHVERDRWRRPSAGRRRGAPPSARIASPVTNALSGPARYRASPAMSSARPASGHGWNFGIALADALGVAAEGERRVDQPGADGVDADAVRRRARRRRCT